MAVCIIYLSSALVLISSNRVLTSLDISNNRFGGYYNAYSGWISDMTGIKALAVAIHECK